MQHSCKTSMFHLFFLLSNQGYTQLFKKNLISLLNSIEASTKFSWRRTLLVQSVTSLCTTWKVFVFGVFLVLIFQHPEWISPYSSGCGKMQIRNNTNMDTFRGVMGAVFITKILFILIYFELIHIASKRLPVFHIEIADSIVIWLLVSSVVSGRSRSILYVKFAG